MPVQFKNEIDVGHVLTLIALTAGFIWWVYTTQREWRKKIKDEARSGALRLLLRILREQKGAPISLSGLYEVFKSDDMKSLRKTYCKRDWKFESADEFEAAVYRLDFEGKIYFISPHEIIFRVDQNRIGVGQFNASSDDKTLMLATLRDAIPNPQIDTWQLEKLAESCMRVAPDLTSNLLREGLKSTDSKVRLRVSSIIGKFAVAP